MVTSIPRLSVLLLLSLALAGCRDRFEGAGDLRAERVVLEREVEGMRQVVARLERGEPLLPLDDIAIAVEDTLVRDLIAAQLPVDFDVDRFHLTLTEADVQFRGSPVVQLRGTLVVRDDPETTAVVTLIGALEDVGVEQSTSTLRATVAADHLRIAEVTGLPALLDGSTLDEVARRVRLQLGDKLPRLQIPVKLQQQIDFAAVTDGPVRLAGARLPLEVSVSQVTAVRGRMWISVRVQAGEFVKVSDAPAVADGNAAEAGLSLDGPTAPERTSSPPAKAPAKAPAKTPAKSPRGPRR